MMQTPATAQQPAIPHVAHVESQPLLTPPVAEAAAIPNYLQGAPTLAAPQPQVAPTAHANLNVLEMEARLRELEARYEEQQARFASLAAEMADGKSDAPKAPAQGTVVGSDLKMNGVWKDGGILESSDKAFRVKWRGRTQFDTVTFTDPHQDFFQGLSGNQGETAVDFRRLRLGTEGILYDQYEFAVELDFMNSFNTNAANNNFQTNADLKNAFDRQYFGVPAPTDVYVGMFNVPVVGNMRVGNIKPANGLEHSNSSRFLDFMERSLNQDAFVGRFNNGFQPGVRFYDWNDEETATYQSTVTMNTYNVFAYDAGGIDVANRLTWAPIYDKESHGRYLVHLGCSVTERRPTDGQDRIRARPSTRNGISQSWVNVADTTIFFTDNELLVIPEFSVVYGPWHFQTEYFAQWNSNIRYVTGPGPAASPVNQGTGYFNGWYAQVSYFLTGEHREYESRNGCFGRVVPYENFYLVRRKGCPPIRTLGAWQVLYRYELLDLNDPALAGVNTTAGAVQGVGGGTCVGHTIGLNHFLNPNMKLQYNVWIADRSASAASPVPGIAAGGLPQTGGATVGFGARWAFDF
jgi:phosphate-selective porin OprO/OprP